MNSTQTTNPTAYLAALLSRARGCLLGQLAGDSLGSLVEFKTAERIRELYPEGVTRMANGGAWNTLAGQPTDDSEMALAEANGSLMANAARGICGRRHHRHRDARR